MTPRARRTIKISGLAIGVAAAFASTANWGVAGLLRSPLHALLSGRILLISMPDRATGEQRTIPVNYYRDGNLVYAGCDFEWWKNLEGGRRVELLIRGRRYTGHAIPIFDPERSLAGFRKLRPKTYDRAVRTEAVLIEIVLDASAPTAAADACV